MVWVHRIPSKMSSSSREPFPAHAFRQACATAGGRGRGCSSPVGRPATAATPPHQTWAGGNCMTACLFVHLLHAQPFSPADFSSLGHVSNEDLGCWVLHHLSLDFHPSSQLSTPDPFLRGFGVGFRRGHEARMMARRWGLGQGESRGQRGGGKAAWRDGFWPRKVHLLLQFHRRRWRVRCGMRQ